MMTWLLATCALILGLVLLFRGDKTYREKAWAQSIEWGYLLILLGIFALLSQIFSFTAVLLLYTVVMGGLWFKGRGATPQERGHFVDYLGGLFPLALIIFVVRTFMFEPFMIPSSSMRPGLIVGDIVLVNKHAYGIRLPIVNAVLIPTDGVKRGDVAIFQYPENPKINYIKRIIGLPGDTVSYRNKVLSINGQEIKDIAQGQAMYMTDGFNQPTHPKKVQVYQETLADKTFSIYQVALAPVYMPMAVSHRWQNSACHYDETGFECKVPAGHYFALGDNRDNSGDSRYWGFINDQLMVGRAWKVLINLQKPQRFWQNVQ